MLDIYSVAKDHKVTNTKLLSFSIRVPKRISNTVRIWKGSFCFSTMGCIVANLVACTCKGSLLVYSRDTGLRIAENKKGITVKKVITCVSNLEKLGYIKNNIGKASRNEVGREVSTIAPTEKFIEEFCKTAEVTKELEKEHILSQPTFLVRDSKGNVLHIPPPPTVIEGGKIVYKLNLLNAQADIRDGNNNPLINIYCRMFNDSYEFGGRWYWADVLRIKHNYPGTEEYDKARLEITIDGNQVLEIDYVNHHFRITAAKLGIPLERVPQDIYTEVLGGNSNYISRFVVKQAVNIMFNCPTEKATIKALGRVLGDLSPFEVEELKGCTAEDIVGGILKHYPEFVNIFKKPKWGCTLQNEDGWLIDKVVQKLLPFGINHLPVHDSFLVMRQYEALLAAAMGEAFREQFKVNWTVPVKVTWKDNGKIHTKLLTV